jgi:hypothetical protein
LAAGDTNGLTVTGRHLAAETARQEQARLGRNLRIKLARKIDDWRWGQL